MSNLNAEELSAILQIMVKSMQSENLISSAACDLWFKHFRLDYLDDEKAVFAVENEMKRSIILNRHAELLSSQIAKVIGYTPKIEIVTDPDMAAGEPLSRTEGVPYPTEIVEQRQAEREYHMNLAREEEKAAEALLERTEKIPDTLRGAMAAAMMTTFMPGRENSHRELPDMRHGLTAPYLRDGSYESTPKDTAYAEINISSSGEENGDKPAAPSNGERRLTYNEDYTFENFVVGNSNQFAHAASLSVAENVGMKFNPLFIYGPSGLGKTHLMYSIANRALKRDPEMKVIYVKGEEFMNQLVEAIRGSSPTATAKFRSKYRSADMLLIDDIQFIAGKEATQEEFFHTFDALYEEHKQIIITSDRPPKELTTLEERIRSRFEAGLIADIQPPDYELRLAILKNKAIQNNLEVPIDVLDFLAENLQSNIRQIEGVVKRLGAKNLLSGMPITMDMVLTTLPEYLRETEPVADTVKRIVEIVAKKYNVTTADIMGTSRKKEIKTARNVAMYIVRTVTRMSLPQIGSTFGRDHSTVHSNINMVESELTTNTLFEATITEIIKEFKRGN